MEKQLLIKELGSFLKTEVATQQILKCLSPKAAIAIRLATSIEVTVRNTSEGVEVIEQAATSPDFIFKATPAAIEVLIAEKGLTPGQLGIKLLKQLISGDVKVAMPASLMQITRKGYLSCLKMGGIEFWNELKKHDLTNVTKIVSALGKLRKS